MPFFSGIKAVLAFFLSCLFPLWRLTAAITGKVRAMLVTACLLHLIKRADWLNARSCCFSTQTNKSPQTVDWIWSSMRTARPLHCPVAPFGIHSFTNICISMFSATANVPRPFAERVDSRGGKILNTNHLSACASALPLHQVQREYLLTDRSRSLHFTSR